MSLNHKTNPNLAPNPAPTSNPAPTPNPNPTPNSNLNPSPFLKLYFICLFNRKSLHSKPYEINHIDYLNMVPYYEFSLSLLVVII